MYRYLILITGILFCIVASANTRSVDKKISVTIKIVAVNKDTGSIRLRYPGEDKIVRLVNGIAVFKTAISNTTEMLLMTNPYAKDLDDSSIIRFLAEPADITIRFIVSNGIPQNIQIAGSPAQQEKDQWDIRYNSLLHDKENIWQTMGALAKKENSSDSLLVRKQMDSLQQKINDIYTAIGKYISQYIRQHPASFLSGYLLYRYHKKMIIDSVEAGYQQLSNVVKTTHFAVFVFDYLFTLSNSNFRKQYNAVAHTQLSNAKNLFDFILPDEHQKPVNLSLFKGKPVLIFFWATWCGPCHQQAPALTTLINEFKDEPISFISISLDKSFDHYKASDKKITLPCTTLVDTENSLRYFYQFLYVPQLILLDKNGKVLVNDAPAADSPGLRAILRNALK